MLIPRADENESDRIELLHIYLRQRLYDGLNRDSYQSTLAYAHQQLAVCSNPLLDAGSSTHGADLAEK
ncbi:hypothetical protein [Dongshaea marina]|uniref:hypothetical protein n=1 Tax=Dongshaea marina TaxID=2047966 RepID=UPI001F41C236|nr:hypothetical protein [Dongshaea marina]